MMENLHQMYSSTGKHVYAKIFAFINQLTSIKLPILTQRSGDFIISKNVFLKIVS